MTRFMLAFLLLTSPVLAQSNEVKPGTAKPQMQTSAWMRPAIQGEERDDDTFRIEAEQPLLVYFFGVKSDSCSSCGLWMQEISRIHDIWSSRGLQVVGISKEETPDLERFLGEYAGITTFPVASDSGENTFRNWLDNSPRKDRLPTVFLVDAKGIIQWIGGPGEELNGLLEDFVKGRYHHELTPYGEKLKKSAKEARKYNDWQDAESYYRQMLRDGEGVLNQAAVEIFRLYAIDRGEVDRAYGWIEEVISEYGDDYWLMADLAREIAAGRDLLESDRRLDVAERLTKMASQELSDSDPERPALEAAIAFAAGQVRDAVNLQRRAVRVAPPILKQKYRLDLERYLSQLKDK